MNTSTDTVEPRDALGAKLLAWGLLAAGVIGAPGQFVLPDTIKSVTASLFVLAAVVVFAWRLDRPGPALRWSPYLLAPFGLALMAVIGTAWAPATMALVEAGRWLLIGLVMWLGMNAFSRGHFVHLARAAQLALFLLAVLALIEFWFDFGWFPADSAPGSTFGNRNAFAEFLATGLPFCLWRLLRQTTVQRAALHGVATGVTVAALMCTGSRAALLGSIGGAVLVLAFYAAGRLRGAFTNTASRATLATALLVPLAVVLALGWLPSGNRNIINDHAVEARGLTPIARASSRLGSLFKDVTYQEGSSFGKRRSAWAAGWKMVAANPVTGVGAGAWNAFSPLYLPEDLDNEQIWYAHNEPLQIVAEYGLAGWAALLALAALVIGSLATAVSRLAKRQDAEAGFQQWVAGLSVVLFVFTSLAGLPLHVSASCYFLAVSLGYLLAAGRGRTFAWSPGQATAGVWAVRGVALVALLVAAVAGIQGMRADLHVQRAGRHINMLALNRQIPKEQATKIREAAVAELRRGLDIYPDHGIITVTLNNRLASLDDPASVLWLSNLMLRTRPHVMDLKCNLIRANSDVGNFKAAGDLLEASAKARPNAMCLPLSEFIYTYKKGQFPETVALGRKMMEGFTSDTDPSTSRYVVDTSYRAAVRVPDIEGAVAILRVRAERWPELRASSWLLIGQLLASRAPAQVVPDAQDAFKRSVAFATSPQDREAVLQRVPEPYRRGLN